MAGSVLQSVGTVQIDSSYPTIKIKFTNQNSGYGHTVRVKDGNTVLFETELTQRIPIGTVTSNINITGTQRNAVLETMSNATIKELTVELITTVGGSQISSSSKTGSFRTSESLSKPVFDAFTYRDINGSTVNLTADNQLFIQGESLLLVVCTAATARNGADIVRYEATVGDKTVISNTTSIEFGKVDDSGTLTLKVSAVDSRGYETTIEQSVEVIPYNRISLESYDIRRENNFEDTIQLHLSGVFSPVTINETDRNSLQRVQYRYKEQSTSTYGSYTDITGAVLSGSAFTIDNDNWLSLVKEKAYNIQIKVTDKLSTLTVSLFVSKGVPLVSFRSGKVGINNNDPQAALDVEGNIAMNGENAQGYVGTIGTSTDLDTVTEAGVYFVVASASGNRPITSNGGLMEEFVTHNTSKRYLQIFYPFSSSDVYMRTAVLSNNTVNWTAWDKLEIQSNKVNSISSSSTHNRYPSAKAVYDFFANTVNDYIVESGTDVAPADNSGLVTWDYRIWASGTVELWCNYTFTNLTASGNWTQLLSDDIYLPAGIVITKQKIIGSVYNYQAINSLETAGIWFGAVYTNGRTYESSNRITKIYVGNANPGTILGNVSLYIKATLYTSNS